MIDKLNEKSNVLLKRKEILFAVEAGANPGFDKVRKLAAEDMKTGEDLVVIKSLKNNFGTNRFVVEAFVYDSKEQKEKIEPRVKEKKTGAA